MPRKKKIKREIARDAETGERLINPYFLIVPAGMPESMGVGVNTATGQLAFGSLKEYIGDEREEWYELVGKFSFKFPPFKGKNYGDDKNRVCYGFVRQGRLEKILPGVVAILTRRMEDYRSHAKVPMRMG